MSERARRHGASAADPAVRARVAMNGFVQRQARDRAVAQALGLPGGAGRLRVLLMLGQSPMTLREIARRHGVDASYATLLVDAFERDHLVRRTQHPDDRRQKIVTLTDAGQAVVAPCPWAARSRWPAARRCAGMTSRGAGNGGTIAV